MICRSEWCVCGVGDVESRVCEVFVVMWRGGCVCGVVGSRVVVHRQGPVIAQLVERLTVVESLALARVQKSNGHRFDSG